MWLFIDYCDSTLCLTFVFIFSLTTHIWVYFLSNPSFYIFSFQVSWATPQSFHDHFNSWTNHGHTYGVTVHMHYNQGFGVSYSCFLPAKWLARCPVLIISVTSGFLKGPITVFTVTTTGSNSVSKWFNYFCCQMCCQVPLHSDSTTLGSRYPKLEK